MFFRSYHLGERPREGLEPGLLHAVLRVVVLDRISALVVGTEAGRDGRDTSKGLCVRQE